MAREKEGSRKRGLWKSLPSGREITEYGTRRGFLIGKLRKLLSRNRYVVPGALVQVTRYIHTKRDKKGPADAGTRRRLIARDNSARPPARPPRSPSSSFHSLRFYLYTCTGTDILTLICEIA